MEPLIPLNSFLHRVFPLVHYDTEELLEKRIFKPRKDCDSFEITFPIDWDPSDRIADRNWRMQLQGWTMFHWLMNSFSEYREKERLLTYFLDVARDWESNYGQDPDDIVTTRMPENYAWYDMSVGFRALVLAFFQDRIQYFKLKISAADKKLLTNLANKHIRHLATPKVFSLNNHGMFQMQGLMALTQLNPGPNQKKYIAYATQKMEDLVVSQFDAQGVHLEHSPHYHFYSLSTFESVLKAGWYKDSDIITSRIKAAQSMCKWLVDPLKRPYCIGDSILTVQKTVEFPKGDEGYLTSKFDASGYSILRSSWGTNPDKATALFLMGAYHHKSHKHRDCLSFEWFDQGQRIICDGGKYGYRSDKFRNYVLSSRAHNSVEIDGFDIIKTEPYGSCVNPIIEKGGVYNISAELKREGLLHRRNIHIQPGKWALIVDWLEFDCSRTTTQWFHFDIDCILESADGLTLRLRRSGGPTDISKIYVDCLTEGATALFHYGDASIIQGYISSADYKIDPASTIGFRGDGKVQQITTAISLSAAARTEAQDYWENTLKKKMPQITRGITENPSVETPTKPSKKSIRLLPNIPHVREVQGKSIMLQPGKATYQKTAKKIPIRFFYDRKDGNPKQLLVLLPGACDRSRGHIHFQRHSWSNMFEEYAVAAFSDPTVRANNDISLGWFQNSKGRYGIDALENIISDLIEQDNIAPENVVLFGSSGGGFVALQMADRFPFATIVVCNPQTLLFKYDAQPFQAMLQVCYPDMSAEQVLDQFNGRMAVKIKPEQRKAPVFIFQNQHDKKHLENHVTPLISGLENSMVQRFVDPITALPAPKPVNVIIYDDSDAGHSPPNKEKTKDFIDRAVFAAHSGLSSTLTCPPKLPSL